VYSVKEKTPRNIDEVLALFEQGDLTPAQTFALFRQLEYGQIPPPCLAAAAVPKDKIKSSQIEERQEKELKIKGIEEELNRLVGLESVKMLVNEITAFVSIQKRRMAEQLVSQPLVLHMIFKGNPGTGKTTVARIFGKLFAAMGVLAKGHLIECERADMVGEYIGHTALRTREQIRKAMGGILFIDEAYSLARGGEKDFGKEAIDTLVKSMEDYKDQFILILAGYSAEMEIFLNSNPGLRSRFPIHIDFPDYTWEELLKIAYLMLKEREYRLTQQARARLISILQHEVLYQDRFRDGNFGNARLVRNIIEKSIRRQAVRLMNKGNISREELILIEQEDIEESRDR
jgi:stage V sporulation protein K